MKISDKLVGIIIRLYNETETYREDQSDAQLWYNRGYANGVVAVLKEKDMLGDLESILTLDDAEIHKGECFMEWEKAYHHGYEMGGNEAKEVLPA